MGAFIVNLLSMWMPIDVDEMEKGTVVFLIFFILSTVFLFFDGKAWQCICRHQNFVYWIRTIQYFMSTPG